MNADEKTISPADLQKELACRVDDAMDCITGGYNTTHNYSQKEMAAYARGLKHMLWALAERYEVSINTDQIDAALGERAQRLGQTAKEFKSIKLRHLATEIRTRRIAMIDEHADCHYSHDYCPLQKKVWRFERLFNGPDTYEEFNRVKLELKALFDFKLILIRDRSWFEKFLAKQPSRQAVAA